MGVRGSRVPVPADQKVGAIDQYCCGFPATAMSCWRCWWRWGCGGGGGVVTVAVGCGGGGGVVTVAVGLWRWRWSCDGGGGVVTVGL